MYLVTYPNPCLRMAEAAPLIYPGHLGGLQDVKILLNIVLQIAFCQNLFTVVTSIVVWSKIIPGLIPFKKIFSSAHSCIAIGVSKFADRDASTLKSFFTAILYKGCYYFVFEA